MNLNFKKNKNPLLQAKAYLKQAIWKTTLMMMMVNFKSDSHDDHLSSLNDSIAYGSQELSTVG